MAGAHIMVDLETLGTTPGSVIRSIGAVVFNPLTCQFVDEFYVNVDRASCEAVGLTVDPATEAWWADQSPEARAALEVDPQPLEVALDTLSAFWSKHAAENFWAHSPDFDKVLLEQAYRATGRAPAWDHRSARCTRTIYDLAGVWPNRDAGVHHNALVDAKNQAVAVHDAYVKLGLAHYAGVAPGEVQATDLFDTVRNLCGYVEDGSNTTFKLSQDDATRNWTASAGPRGAWGHSPREAIEKLAAEQSIDAEVAK